MSTHDMVLDNQAGAAFRADLNNALQALASNQSSAGGPPTTYAYQFWADTTNGLLRMRNGANNAWITLGLLGVANFGLILPGTIVYHAKNAAPSGFLKANGAAVSRTTYADLFTEIGTTFGSGNGTTTFNLPELRAEFIRGWDDSRGVDSGRTFGSAQSEMIGPHTHPIQHQGSYGYTGGSNTAYGLDIAENSSANSGTENRPRNVALLACIKI